MSFRRVHVLINESDLAELRSIVDAGSFGPDTVAGKILRVALLQAEAQVNNPSKEIREVLPQRGILNVHLHSPTELAEKLGPLAEVMTNRMPSGQQTLDARALNLRR